MTLRHSPKYVRSPADLDSDSSHAFFVETLNDCRAILVLLVSETSQTHYAPIDPVESQNRSSRDLANMFDYLSIENLSTTETGNKGKDDNNEAEKSAENLESAVPELTCKVEDFTDRLEASAAILYLLQDLQKIRENITTCWEDYEKGEMDLVAAALTSDTALEPARRMEEDSDIFASYGGTEQLLETYHDTLCGALRRIARIQGPQSKRRRIRSLPYRSGKLLVQDLQALTDFRASGVVKTVFKPFRNAYKPEVEPYELTAKEKIDEDTDLLSDLFSDLALLQSTPPEPQITLDAADDELTRGSDKLYSSDTVELWFVFATQIFLSTFTTSCEKTFLGVSAIFTALVWRCSAL